MAQLDPSNIVNGNTIAASDLLQLYNALTAGGGYDVSISGSLTGSATTATSATSASNITTAITGGGTHYLAFVEGAGTKAPKIASLLEYTPSTNNLQVTASFATTASFAVNGGVANQVVQQQYQRNGGVVGDATVKFITGTIAASGGVATTGTFSLLTGKTLGVNVFITATIEAASANAGNIVVIKAISGNAITFNTAGGSGNELIHYIATILQ
jgi:hypothetical protein